MSGGAAADAFVVTPFARMARTHAASVAGDALLALALANSLFFSITPDAARERILLYLALTMAPFALISPLVGPAIDRAKGGRRMMVVVTAAARVVVAVLMVFHLDSLLLFPEAFVALVAGKGYHVAKSALVPTLVRHEGELVEANSKLALLSGIAGSAAFVPGLAVMQLGGGRAVLVLSAASFTLAAVLAMRIPATQVAVRPPDAQERAELRGAGVLFAATSMAYLRGLVGFLAFLLAFHLRAIDAATVWFGVMLGASTLGNLAGAALAPVLRRVTREEVTIVVVLGLTAVVAAFVVFAGGLGGAALLAGTVGLAAGAGKQSFDAIVQRDAPDANQGRSFARFETRFQLVWVAGALVPTILPFDVLSERLGYLVIAGTAGFGGFTYLAALRAIDRGEAPVPPSIRRNLGPAAKRLARRRPARPRRDGVETG